MGGFVDVVGRVVVVTGGGSGIGRACAVALADRGARVVVVDRDELAARTTVDALPGGGHRSAALNIADGDRVAELFGDLAAAGEDLAGVVNAAGIVSGGDPWPSSDLARMRAVLTVNAIGTITTTTLAANYPVAGTRAVVNLASAAAIRPLPPDPAYAASKAAVLAFTRSAALGAGNLRVNVLLPGVVRTPMLDTTGSSGVADWLAHRLEGPLLTAEQVAQAVIALLVEDHNGIAWSIELDPKDPSTFRVDEV
jgi:3-oxoacyl-[acyl-carrier protein] reductase